MITKGENVVVELYGKVLKQVDTEKFAVETDYGTLNGPASRIFSLPLPPDEPSETMPCPQCNSPMTKEGEEAIAWFCRRCETIWQS